MQVSPERLKELEEKYGGVRYVTCTTPSIHGGYLTAGYTMRGGDRMGDLQVHATYAPTYSSILSSLSTPILAVELGILQGSGLAILCDCLPSGSSVIGLDVDPSIYQSNLEFLLERGAFKVMSPVVEQFDQLDPNRDYVLQSILAGRKIDLLIDDALHDTETIMLTFDTFLPFMSAQFIYVIEDNADVSASLKDKYPKLTHQSLGYLTVITS